MNVTDFDLSFILTASVLDFVYRSLSFARLQRMAPLSSILKCYYVHPYLFLLATFASVSTLWYLSHKNASSQTVCSYSLWNFCTTCLSVLPVPPSASSWPWSILWCYLQWSSEIEATLGPFKHSTNCKPSFTICLQSWNCSLESLWSKSPQHIHIGSLFVLLYCCL